MARHVPIKISKTLDGPSTAYVFLLVVFIMGSVSGAFAVKTLSPVQNDELITYVQGVLQTFSPLPWEDVLTNAKASFWGNIGKTVGLMWVLGLSVLGAPFILALAFLRGFVLGFTVAFMVQGLMAKGIALAFASVIPHNLLNVPGIILAGGASFGFSLSALKVLFGRGKVNIAHKFVNTGILILLASVCIGLGALVESYITPMLIEVTTRYLP